MGGVDGNRKVGAVAFPVLRDHSLESEFVCALFCKRHTNESPAVGGHEIDGLRGDFFRCQHQISLVFTVGVIGDNDKFARADICKDIFYGIERRGLGHDTKLAHCPVCLNLKCTKDKTSARGCW